MSETTLSNEALTAKEAKLKTKQDFIDKLLMRHAMGLAKKAEQHNEIPVGAVVVANGEIIGEGFNQSIMLNDPSAHAEMIAIREAGKTLENYRMLDCTLYVTLEPCPMCAGLLVHSRIKRIVYGCKDEKTGAAGSVFNLVNSDRLNHTIDTTSGVLGEECSAMLSAFFKKRRQEKKQLKQQKKASAPVAK
ncbi:tRNA adenosine(34) deaminase TadA [Thalassotalea atypica]|uniref:tRNA adenosine(34) deaminase TadA n=1 Tax=Thalassotalea atypica TaxID=2054316 RepID=UPI002573E25B|nr:tRNA adenosine(34) deaminase TadA [Thalassotalea atypica]